MKEKWLGILTIVFTITLIVLGILLLSQGIDFDALYVKLLILNTSALLACSGMYLVKRHANSAPITEKIILTAGLALIILSGLVAFDILSWMKGWNWLIAAALGFITMVQLQMINWDESKGLMKLLGLIIVLSNLFAIALIAFKLSHESLGLIFDFAIIASVFAFLLAIAFNPKKVD